MSDTLTSLGAGVLFAYLALPVFSWAARRDPQADAQSRQGPLLLALFAAIAVALVPFVVPPNGPGAPVTGGAAGLWSGAAEAAPVASGVSFSPLGALGALWSVLFVLAGGRTVLSFLRLHAIAAQATPADETTQAVVERLADELFIPRPRVRLSALVDVPLVVPTWTPTVLLPVGLAAHLQGARLDLALRHELTHIARRDHRIASLIALLRLPFVLHPSAARLEFELALAREEAVDARVGARDRTTYAQLLLEVATLRPKLRRLIPVPAMGDQALSRRVETLLDARHRPLARIAPVLIAAVLGVVGAAVAQPSPRSSPDGTVRLSVGQQRVLSLPGISRLSIGDPGITDVRPLNDAQVLLIGTGPGATTLLTWTQDGARKSFTVFVTEPVSAPTQ